MRKLPFVVLAAVVWLIGPAARAEVKPYALFTDGMVLQQDQPCPVWGTAEPGETFAVVLKVGGERIGSDTVRAGQDGKWRFDLPKLKAGGPYSLNIGQVTVNDVYVGEVWVCSGQSNMEWRISQTADAEKAIANAKNPKIRLFTVPHTVSATPLTEVTGKWSECNPDTVKNFSAVAYYFGRDLQKALDVPVGLIHSSWGGTIAEAWATKEALEAEDDLKGLIPQGEIKPKVPNQGTVLYNGMIAPLIPFAIKGAIWYQGESNAGRAYQYRTLFPAMIKSWRTAWKQGDFPFLFVQLAPYENVKEPTWPELREAQLFTSLKLKNTGMAVITDVGEAKDIHPKQKEPVGARLALAARAIAYGENIPYQGPLFDHQDVDGNKAILSFKNVGKGLEVRGEALKGFTIAGEDKQFHEAKAEIKGDQIVVSSDKVEKPVAVRYGWANFPVVNLWNKDGLPASPFRTDDFPMVTAPKPK
jgi:sialate O-acetylesterase